MNSITMTMEFMFIDCKVCEAATPEPCLADGICAQCWRQIAVGLREFANEYAGRELEREVHSRMGLSPAFTEYLERTIKEREALWRGVNKRKWDGDEQH